MTEGNIEKHAKIGLHKDADIQEAIADGYIRKEEENRQDNQDPAQRQQRVL